MIRHCSVGVTECSIIVHRSAVPRGSVCTATSCSTFAGRSPLGVIAVGFAAAVELLKIKFAFSKIVLLCAGLLLFVACILFFLTSVPYDGLAVGIGAIFSAFFALFAACGCCYAGLVLSK